MPLNEEDKILVAKCLNATGRVKKVVDLINQQGFMKKGQRWELQDYLMGLKWKETLAELDRRGIKLGGKNGY